MKSLFLHRRLAAAFLPACAAALTGSAALLIPGVTVAAEAAASLKVSVSLAPSASAQEADWVALLNGRAGLSWSKLPSAPGNLNAVGDANKNDAATAKTEAGSEVLLLIGHRDSVPDRAAPALAGRGLVVIDDFTKSGPQVESGRALYGGVAELPAASDWRGQVPLFFTPPGMAQPVSAGVSNFEVNSGFTWNLSMDPAATVLATTWTPHRKNLRGGSPQPYVYGVTPVIWTLDNARGRTVSFNLSGTEMLKNPALRALVLRSLAWAAKKPEAEISSLCTPGEIASLPYPPDGPLSPEAAVKALKPHPDFNVSLVAAEPLVSKAINIDWDAQGRLWVAESLEYPEGKRGGGPESMYAAWQRDTSLPKPPAADRPGRDRISWLEDTDGDGRMDKKHVFADDLDMVTSFCFYRDGVIAAQPPLILFLRDTDGDGKADRRETLYAGLGTQDTHAVLNNLRWGLDGWIYATHGYSSSPKVTSGDGKTDFGAINSGVIRFRPDGSAIEMRTAKSGNCWGVDITSEGELFFTQPTSGDLVMHAPLSDRFMAEGGLGREPSWKVLVHLRPVHPLMSHDEIVANQPNDVIGSFTAACGCALYEGGSWPAEWTRGYFTCEPTVHIVHHEVITPDGVSFAANPAREEEFSATRDFWHRPIDTRVGPDGDLYVTDFYNQAILHNDPRGPIHLWNNQAARPDRDHYFGRILRYRNQRATALPTVDLATETGRLAALGHPNREIRFKAQRLLEENPDKLRTAAGQLAATASSSTAGPARVHALWLRAAAGVLTETEAAAALTDGDTSVRSTIARVLAEHPALVTDRTARSLAGQLALEAEPRVRLLLLAAVPASHALPADLLIKLAAAPATGSGPGPVASSGSAAKSNSQGPGAPADAWTRAAVLRNALPQSLTVWRGLFESDAATAADAYLAESLISQNRQNPANLAAMLEVVAASGAKHPDLGLTGLQSLSRADFATSGEVKAALSHLLTADSPALVSVALPLAASAWTAAEQATLLPPAAEKVLAFAQAAGTPSAEKTAAFAALARLPIIAPAARAALRDRLQEPAVLEALCANPAPAAAECLTAALPGLAPDAKAKAIESLLSRKESALALLTALDSGEVTLAVAGPSVLSRLEKHPDHDIATRAAGTARKLRGAMEARDAIIARLLPEVLSQPGDPANGRNLFAACAVCHQFQGQGVSIGPILDGIGIHSAEALLTHIIDPNREVEPSFHAWTITRKNGETVSGIISRETASSLFVRSPAGETEVPRDSIASRVNTGLSLMPEGFESFGPGPLRDLIAYLQSGSTRYHAIPFGKAATADGSQGVYLSRDTEGDRVSIKKYGIAQVQGVPFSLPDPAGTVTGNNLIVLKGGWESRAVSQTMPESVELPVNQPAGRLHLLGAVAGWGWPADGDKRPLVTITVHYQGGETEDIVLTNGVEFADHIAGVDVPGSTAATDVVARGQMRYLWRDLKKPGAAIEKITLHGHNRRAAPMIAALTMESPDHDGKLAPPPATGGPAPR